MYAAAVSFNTVFQTPLFWPLSDCQCLLGNLFFSKFNSDVLIHRFIILECCAHYHASSVYCMFIIRVRFLKLVLRLMLQYFTVSNSALTFLKMFRDILCWFSDRFVMFLTCRIQAM